MYNHTKHKTRIPSSIYLQELELGDNDDDDVMMALQTNYQSQH